MFVCFVLFVVFSFNLFFFFNGKFRVFTVSTGATICSMNSIGDSKHHKG